MDAENHLSPPLMARESSSSSRRRTKHSERPIRSIEVVPEKAVWSRRAASPRISLAWWVLECFDQVAPLCVATRKLPLTVGKLVASLDWNKIKGVWIGTFCLTLSISFCNTFLHSDAISLLHYTAFFPPNVWFVFQSLMILIISLLFYLVFVCFTCFTAWINKSGRMASSRAVDTRLEEAARDASEFFVYLWARVFLYFTFVCTAIESLNLTVGVLYYTLILFFSLKYFSIFLSYATNLVLPV